MKVVYGEGWYSHDLSFVLLRKPDGFLKGVVYYACLVGGFSCPPGQSPCSPRLIYD
jgi:hypothetical protein